VIVSLKGKSTRLVWDSQPCKKLPPEIQQRAREVMVILHAATAEKDLWAHPGLKLHKLSKDRTGQHAVWINDKWRICWEWDIPGQQMHQVEITDYH
jgi:toxin HigB-1